jgi:hypothetical protein
MTDATRVFSPGFQVTNAAGTPQSGAVLRFYAAGTSNTRTVYSDLGLSTSLGVTVTTNSSGRPAASGGAGAEVVVYTGTTAYKVTAETSAGVSLWSFDNVIGALDTSSFLTGTVTAETPVITKTADYTILTADQGSVINANPTGSTFTLTLPSAVTAGDGWRIHIRHTGTANSVNIATVSAQTINGATSRTLDGQYQAIQLVSDAANWHIDGDALGTGSVAPFNMAAAMLPYGGGVLNGTMSASVSASALTISILNYDGTAPSTSKPVKVGIRSATVGSGDYSVLSLTASTTLVVSSGSTLGATNSIAFKGWIVAFNDAGTLRLGIINCLSSTSIYPLGQMPIASSTAEGGAGGADSAQVFYTGTAVTSKPYQVLGYISYEGGLSTVGTWNVAPTRLQLFGPGIPLPGQSIQVQQNVNGTVSTGSTVMPVDNTVPQNTEGDQYMTQAVTPTSASNLLIIEFSGQFDCSNANTLACALFQDSTANALTASAFSHSATAGVIRTPGRLHHAMLAGTTSSTTFKVRVGPSGAGTVAFNGVGAGTQAFNGSVNSYMTVEERMT